MANGVQERGPLSVDKTDAYVASKKMPDKQVTEQKH